MERRTDALSKKRIVEAAIAILDNDGEGALTFRTLATRLATGSGAIYWHVADKDELLAAATGEVIGHVVTGDIATNTEQGEAIRTVALGLFDAIDRRPWVGTQLSRQPWQPAMGLIFETVGRQIQSLGVPRHAQFDAASALVNYILGVAGQNAANARLMPDGTDRKTALETIVVRWTEGNPAAFPFVREVADQMREHDDRQQFLAGIDLILAGIQTL